jgi:hypothetical protein
MGKHTHLEDSQLDGCDVDMAADPLPEGEEDLLVLFVEALDPENPKTVEQVKAEWDEIFS